MSPCLSRIQTQEMEAANVFHSYLLTTIEPSWLFPSCQTVSTNGTPTSNQPNGWQSSPDHHKKLGQSVRWSLSSMLIRHIGWRLPLKDDDWMKFLSECKSFISVIPTQPVPACRFPQIQCCAAVEYINHLPFKKPESSATFSFRRETWRDVGC